MKKLALSTLLLAGWFVQTADAGDDLRRKAALAGKLSPAEGAELAKELKKHFADKGNLDATDTGLAFTACKNLEQVIPGEIGALYADVIAQLEKSPKATGAYLNMMKGHMRRTVGQTITVFKGKTVTGDDFDLSKYKGKVVLFDFWATWCGPCKAEMPNILKAYEKYHDHGFEVVGVSIDAQPKMAADFLAEKKYPWISLYEKQPKAAGNMCELYQIPSVPFLILIDRDGKVVYMKNRGGEPLAAMIEKQMTLKKSSSQSD